MIDIHSHILPYMDDGAKDWNMAISMAKQAYADGIRNIVATPHHRNGRYMNESFKVLEIVELLNSKLRELDLDITVFPGQEIRIHDDLLHHLEDGEIQLLHGSRYMLLELPSSNIPSTVEDVIYELSLMNIQVIIAHPERNAEIATNPDRLERLIEFGALAQLTAQSVTGEKGGKLQRLSLDLCKRSLIHFIATDAHDLVSRPFQLSRSYQVIEKKLGSEMVNYFKDNAKRLVGNLEITTNEAAKERVRGNNLAKVLSGMFRAIK
ncbi:tyrosine-protein phosphatase [Paenibacillus gallinarum]|uniref:Tyrosine-protein phosphatase n=1 Tax=Paenibacillus gallinarum TaxID=2762232 RepID=A0ABR8T4N4_9BACL|nr:CpsB/CapC family capsule biosynthesis tyrosine phosphatase [Paenibacillus gallinarum]MBD7970560.1 tyrosine protein phosphatase [Paenibacillus gallinarum]